MAATSHRRARRAATVLGVTTLTVLAAASPAFAADYGPQPVPPSSPSVTSQGWFLPAALVAVGLGLLVLLIVAFLSADRDAATSGRVGRRLGKYSLTTRGKHDSSAPEVGALGGSQVARSAVDLAGRVVQKRDLDTNLGSKLEAAGVPLRPAEWLVIHVGAPIVLGLGLLLLSGFKLLPALIGVAIGTIVPFAYLSIKESKRKAAFAAQLPDTLQLLAGSLSTGYSLPQATDVVVRESAAPMSVELGRSLVEARLGVPLEDSLEATATRMDSVDFAWVVMAIRIQREVGGNLAEILNSVATTMRERERLRRQVQVLSAEGRLSAVILGGLPLLLIVYMVLVRPEYISLLVTSSLGILMSVVGVALLVGGSFWLRKVVKVEV
jgi:tight adherence protein B